MKRLFTHPPLIGLACTLALVPLSAQAYIDPGTGSLLLQGLIGAVAGVMVAASLYWSKIKSFFRKDRGTPDSALDDALSDDPSPGDSGGSPASPAGIRTGEVPVLAQAQTHPQAQMDAQAQVQARAQVHVQTQIKEPVARLDPDRHPS